MLLERPSDLDSLLKLAISIIFLQHMNGIQREPVILVT